MKDSVKRAKRPKETLRLRHRAFEVIEEQPALLPSRSGGWLFWIGWALVNAFGTYNLAAAGAGLLSYSTPAGTSFFFLEYPAQTISDIAFGVAGLVVQWWLLRHYLGGLNLWRWAGYTLVGALTAGLLVGFIYFLVPIDAGIPLSLAWALGGVMIGLLQFAVLRAYFKRAGWWVAACALALTIAESFASVNYLLSYLLALLPLGQFIPGVLYQGGCKVRHERGGAARKTIKHDPAGRRRHVGPRAT